MEKDNYDLTLKVAKLARIRIEETELEQYSENMKQIIGFVDEIAQADVSELKPMSHPFAKMQQRLREDEVTEPNTKECRDELQAVAPSVEDGLFCVPNFMKEE